MGAIILEHYLKVRHETLKICEPLEIEDYSVQPRDFVSPPKWHLAHTTWFFEELVLKPHNNKYTYFNKSFSFLFNSYYKSLGEHWQQHERGLLSRPTVKEIRAYRSYVDEHMIDIIKASNFNIAMNNLIMIGIQHEQQHQELLYMDIKYILGVSQSNLLGAKNIALKAKKFNQDWKFFEENIVEIGSQNDVFCYDNEKPCHKRYIYPFAVSTTLVSNGEFLAFVNSDAYLNPKYWLSLGWEWVLRENIKHPLYWKRIGHSWFEYTLNGLQELDLNAPVAHVSYFEADAYASYKNARLPSEFEFEVYLRSEEVKVYSNSLHPHCVKSPRGQLWCWTNSAYGPYPGFKPFQSTLKEYNAKFMCNQFVLKSGSIVTPVGHYRDSYRNFFPPEQRWMFSGIRLAKDL
jgi:ergothioneine biosynthesis protein EgtB